MLCTYVTLIKMFHSFNLPICLLVISTGCVLLTFDNRPRQKRSEFEGSVKPSTVSDGWDAWNVSPTLVFNS